MSSAEPVENRSRKAILMVCDPAGNVQAVTSKMASDRFPGVSCLERDFAEILGVGSPINRWLSDCIQEARERDEYSAETRVEDENGPLVVRLESLARNGELCGFTLQIIPLSQPGDGCTLHEGDSIVARKQWHEIKNHVGALKLYATFLKRQMPDGDERRIVEKIFNGVNALIGYMDKIRRGEPQ